LPNTTTWIEGLASVRDRFHDESAAPIGERIRPSTPEDLPAVGVLLSGRMAHDYFGCSLAPAEIAQILLYDLQSAQVGKGVVWVSALPAPGNRIIAYATVMAGEVAYCVDPEYRRLGCASRLLEVMRQAAFSTWPGVVLSASVLRENAGSARMLEKLGFQFKGLYRPSVKKHAFAQPMLSYESHARQLIFQAAPMPPAPPVVSIGGGGSADADSQQPTANGVLDPMHLAARGDYAPLVLFQQCHDAAPPHAHLP
jgi:RimJ/RimL family protein N-acetyltransferase